MMNLLEGLVKVPQYRSAIGQIVQWIESQVVVLLFWSAILLPVSYLPLLITRLHSSEKLALFVVLIGLHFIALIGGHAYRRPIHS